MARVRDYGDHRPVWVVYHKGSGSVVKLSFSDPGRPTMGYAVLATNLSQRAVGLAHQLLVRNGRVVHGPSLAGV